MQAIPRCTSLHGRDYELGTFLSTGRPARGNGFGLGVEADRIGTMLVEVAETGAFPAAEGMISERDRDGEIHPDHSNLNAVDEIARRIAVTGEYGDAVSIFVFGRKAHGFFIVFRAHD